MLGPPALPHPFPLLPAHLPLPLPLLPFPIPSPSLSRPLPPLPTPPLRSSTPWLRLGGLGERSSSPCSGSGRSPAAKRFLVHFQPIWTHFGKHFGQLILRKIIEILVTRCQILRLKCTKFDFGWGSPDPAGGAGCLRPRRIFALKYGTYYLLK